MQTLYVQGRWIAPEQLDWIRQLILEQAQWGRFRLSVHIAEQWDWRNGAGQLKDMAARSLLLKLEGRGLIELPRRRSGGGSRPARPPQSDQLGLATEPLLEAELGPLLPLNFQPAQSTAERQELARLLAAHHYLGYLRPVGENLSYLARARRSPPGRFGFRSGRLEVRPAGSIHWVESLGPPTPPSSLSQQHAFCGAVLGPGPGFGFPSVEPGRRSRACAWASG